MKILDIDLDFFLNETKNWTDLYSTERLDDDIYKPWAEENVISFLENQCGLSMNKKINGKFCIHHDEVFYYIKNMIENGNLAQFEMDHVDAHADLGLGDTSFIYILRDLLKLDLDKRSTPITYQDDGYSGLSCGNFLAFIIACRWLTKLNYIKSISTRDDLPTELYFKNFDKNSGYIQFKQFDQKILDDYSLHREEISKENVISYEPEVEFNVIKHDEFKSDGKYDFIFLTQSPGFTPKKSDKLIDIIKRYIKLI